ncbi:hypothetical protein CapIbe_001305 [Capra ibex]
MGEGRMNPTEAAIQWEQGKGLPDSGLGGGGGIVAGKPDDKRCRIRELWLGECDSSPKPWMEASLLEQVCLGVKPESAAWGS